jgi:type IV pilus assembly protein PilC
MNCKGVIEEVSSGQTFASALNKHFRMNDFLLTMVHVGEQSGSLGQSLHQAALILQGNDERKKKIIGAFVYPGFIALATLGISSFLVIYIFPKIIPLITSMKIELPLLTKIVMHISDTVRHDWYILFPGATLTFLLFYIVWIRTLFLKKFCFSILFSTPLLGKIFCSSAWVILLHPISALLGRGESLPLSLSCAGEISKYNFYTILFTEASEYVKTGGSLSDYFEIKSKLYPKYIPPLVIELLLMGEKTAGIKEACDHLIDIFKAEVEESIARLSQSIEPILMICMGCIVGSIALSIILPIYEITNHLTK